MRPKEDGQKPNARENKADDKLNVLLDSIHTKEMSIANRMTANTPPVLILI